MSGPIFAPAKPEESLLLEVVRDGLMPPPMKGEPFTHTEVKVIQQWIASGAEFERSEVTNHSTVTEREISQIMLLRCAVCHGARTREAGLDLRSRAAMLHGGKSGPAIDLDKPAESLILKKIHSGDMPPLRKLAAASIKVIEKTELDTLTKWIESGAPVAARPADGANEREEDVTDKDRQFWSFQPPTPQPIPTIDSSHRLRNPVDAFVLEKLESVGLSLSPEADRRTLIRRAYFDLLGLPPSPSEVESFVADRDPQAYEKLVDRLLASRHYGERWGRFWLDVAGYADSDGVNEEDPIRPYAYRYRDYVIRSFNSDKPYDRFLLEQVAGDELADYEHAELTDEIYDNLVATGFLRMGPDGTYNGLTNFVPDRLEVIAAEIGVLTSAVMGLTIKCARCHAHKFDPIPHRDYYRLSAIFKGAYDENDWLRPAKSGDLFPLRGINFAFAGEKETWEAEQKRLKAEIERAQGELESRRRELVTRQLDTNLPMLQAELREDVRTAALESHEKRNEVQKYLIAKFAKLLHIDFDELQTLNPDFRTLALATAKQVKVLKDQTTPNEPFIQALWDRGEPTPTYVLRRGNYLSPGREVEPGIPAVLTDGKTPLEIRPPWPGAKQTGRRLAFARWLVKPDNPLTSRVMVNRIWKHHFSDGIVKSLDNFGKSGTPPTHPELLDWLSMEFSRNGWSMKFLHRMIMLSSTYRQSSQVAPEQERADPDNRLLSRFPLRRLEAEALRDSLLAVSGRLDLTPFGPAERVVRRDDGLVTSVGTNGSWRRSVYVLQRRTQTTTILDDFDFPQMAPNCVERTAATVAPQALHLLNSRMIQELSSAMAGRIIDDVGSDQAAQIRRAFAIALGRQPDSEELILAETAFDAFRERWQATARDPSSDGIASPSTATPSPVASIERKSLANLCHALMNSAEFIYID